jgi:hypothetical protein
MAFCRINNPILRPSPIAAITIEREHYLFALADEASELS